MVGLQRHALNMRRATEFSLLRKMVGLQHKMMTAAQGLEFSLLRKMVGLQLPTTVTGSSF